MLELRVEILRVEIPLGEGCQECECECSWGFGTDSAFVQGFGVKGIVGLALKTEIRN